MTLWGGRFQKKTDQLMRQFSDSISFDRRLHQADITGSIAYAQALKRAGVITAEEADQIQEGLEEIRNEFSEGSFQLASGDEDIHTAVERRLGELIGESAGKLHTGRSRNDQVATSLRLYLKTEIETLRVMLIQLQSALISQAETHPGVIMPGYTHLQPAQPVLFSHWVMAYFWKFQRDRERLEEALRRIDVCPLGSGALAGTPLPIDRWALAEDLGFSSVSENSLDAVSDRDPVVEILSWAALLQTHLSQWAEDLILWSSPGFGFITLDESYTTGSSLLPQKKNPDGLELIRGKSGRIYGHLLGMLTTLKGLPLAYNKDLQEDKEALFQVLDTLARELPIARGIIRSLHIHPEQMKKALNQNLLAADLADYLVRQGIPFRESHRTVGKTVRLAEELDLPLHEMDLETYQKVHPAFGPDLFDVFDFQTSVQRRSSQGGTAPRAVQKQIDKAKKIIGNSLEQ